MFLLDRSKYIISSVGSDEDILPSILFSSILKLKLLFTVTKEFSISFAFAASSSI